MDKPRVDREAPRKKVRSTRRGRLRPMLAVSRVAVTTAFLLVALVVIWIAYAVGIDSGQGTLLLDLGVEIIGIVITVAVVDWFFERRRLQERARQLAWNALHAVEHAVWVWQGGPREIETDELLGILAAVGPDDPIPEFTQNLFLNLGTRSKQVFHNDAPALSGLRGLQEAFQDLTRLNAVREGGAVIPSRKLAGILEEGVERLAFLLGQRTERYPANLIRFRDPSLEMQEQRHYGVRAGRERHGPGGPLPTIRF